MRIAPLAVASVLFLGVVGCSKKSAATEAPAAESPAPVATKRPAAAADDGAYDPNAAAAQAGAAPAAAAKKAAAAEGGSGKNWDAVIAEIVQLRRTPGRSSTQTERLNALEDELISAVKSDPAAREAHQNLSRIINGR